MIGRFMRSQIMRRISATPVQFAVALVTALESAVDLTEPSTIHFPFVFFSGMIGGILVCLGRLLDNQKDVGPLYLEIVGDALLAGTYIFIIFQLAHLSPDTRTFVAAAASYVGLACGFLLRWYVVNSAIKLIQNGDK